MNSTKLNDITKRPTQPQPSPKPPIDSKKPVESMSSTNRDYISAITSNCLSSVDYAYAIIGGLFMEH